MASLYTLHTDHPLQQAVLGAIRSEFPELSPAAQEITQVRDIEYLGRSLKMIYQAPNEDAVR